MHHVYFIPIGDEGVGVFYLGNSFSLDEDGLHGEGEFEFFHQGRDGQAFAPGVALSVDLDGHAL